MLRALLALLSTASLLSLATYFWLAYRGDSALLYSISTRLGPPLHGRALLLLAALGLLACLFQGAQAMLFWLSPSWGSLDDDGAVQTVATGLASLFAFGGLFFISFLVRASRNDVLLQVSQQRTDGLTEILEAALDRRRLAEIEVDLQKRIAAMTAALTSLPLGAGYDEAVRRQLGPSGERVAVLHDLVSAVQRHVKRLGPIADS